MLGKLQEENKVTDKKMTEHVRQVTTKDPKNVIAGKRLTVWNHRNRQELTQRKAQKSESKTKRTYYGAGAVVTIGVLGVISVITLTNPRLIRRILFIKPSKLQFTSPRKLQINLTWFKL